MQRRLSALAGAAIAASLSLLKSWRSLIAIDTRGYAPERHYMRGPGPKWREKHGRVAI